MSLLKHAMVVGINDALVDSGVASWPNEAVGFEVCGKIADDLSGPDVLPEGGLSHDSAILIANRIKEAADILAANGYTQDAESAMRTKQASEMNFEDRAAMVAEACMSKAAAEASLTDVGPNTEESAAQTDQHAALDLKNRPAGKYLTGVGRTMFPNGGVVGQQMMAPERQAGPNISNSLTSLDKQADDGSGILEPLRGYAGRAISNPAAGASGLGFVEGARHIGGNVVRHPVAHAAALAAALYGGSKGIDALREHLADDKALTDRELQQMADGGNEEMAAYLASKQANEDMAAADLASDMTPGPTPGALERAKMMLIALKNRIPGFRPSPEAVAAASGLGEEGAPGMEVMAHIVDTVKTAEEAEAVLGEVFQLQVQNEKTASEVLYQAVQEKLADEAEAAKEVAEKAPGLLMRNKGKALAGTAALAAAAYGGKKLLDRRRAKKEEEARQEAASKAAALRDIPDDVMARLRDVKELPGAIRHAIKSRKSGVEGQAANALYALKQRGVGAAKVVGGTAALAGAAYGGKKLLDRRKAKKEEEAKSEEKAAALLEYLKAAADGSLTDVGENTPESAAQTDSVAELDMENRSPNEYLMGVGKTKMPNKGQVYAVEHADQDDPVHTDNLPTNETKSAELAYVQNFRKIAADLGPYLPATMSRDEKVAHLQTMLGLPPSERVEYVQALRAG